LSGPFFFLRPTGLVLTSGTRGSLCAKINPMGKQILLRVLLLMAIALPAVGCDRVTKSLATEHLADRPARSWFHDVVRLQYAENSGAFLSIGATLPTSLRRHLLVGLTSTMLAVCVAYLLLKPSLATGAGVALSLIIAGGAGNLWDRIHSAGTVIDFLNLGIGGLRTGIFNIADVLLLAGVLLLLAADLRWFRRDARARP
jgi:signal peptidase II